MKLKFAIILGTLSFLFLAVSASGSMVSIRDIPIHYQYYPNNKANFICAVTHKVYPKIKKWQKLILSTGLAKKSVAQDFQKIFLDFYLSPVNLP